MQMHLLPRADRGLMRPLLFLTVNATTSHSASVPGAVAHHCGMYPDEDTPRGWVKPSTKPTRESLKTRVAELCAELAMAEAQLREIEQGERLEALVKIRNLMRGFELTLEDLGLTTTPRRRGRPRKILP